jgi:hypothetical protein
MLNSNCSGLHDPEDKGVTILPNAGNYLSVNSNIQLQVIYLLYYAVTTQHIKQLHYYNWLHSTTCFGHYPAIIRPTSNSVN